MTPQQFRKWRKALNFSQMEAASALGLKRRIVQYYEKGERDGTLVIIPKAVRLACYALTLGTEDYAGPAGAVSGADNSTAARSEGVDAG